MSLKLALSLISLVFISGCQTTQGPLATNNFTFNADKTRTKEAIIATFVPRGYQIVKDSEFQLVMDRPANDSFGAQLVYGSQWNSIPNARVILTITGSKPTNVNSQIQVVTNPGSGFERVNDVSNHAESRNTIAAAMEQAKAKLGNK